MISQLSGSLVEKYASSVVIDVGGVGIEIELTMGMMFQLPPIGDRVTVCTHFVVREDAMLLYGFQNQSERTLFRLLIKISGIGPKVAIGILSTIAAADFVSAVKSGNSYLLTQIPGVGKKTAERLVVELRDKLKDTDFSDIDTGSDSTSISDNVDSRHHGLHKEAESALVALGYKANDATKLVNMALQSLQQQGDDSPSVQVIIRQSLKFAVKS